ncbi:MAG: peroxiredoxin [Cellvibrionales bacterium]|nr:redoxin domain-containing protein [Porticoccaceae bacterium]|tara:strand:- start:14153 stop:14698 length:546 start_codon:yes stop_codon:yes gene_type:complete
MHTVTIKKIFSVVLATFLTNWTLTGATLEVGDKAPNFKLEASDGKTYQLSDLLDRQAVVIAWYPFAFTSGCTIECKSLADNGHLLKRLEVAYFMASVDPVEKNREFADAYQADFPLLSDPTKQAARDYEVLSLGMYAKRHTFYIGKDGNILFIDRDVRPAQSAQDMAAKLEELGVPARTAS